MNYIFFLENKHKVLNVSSLIDTNINNDYDRAMRDIGTPWIILKLAHGCSLTDFIEKSRRAIGLHEAIKFCINLANIVSSFHACGVVHRDLKPDNIHIDCSEDSSLAEGDITVLDFGLAYIEQKPWIEDGDLGEEVSIKSKSSYETDTGQDIGNRFYRVSQMTKQQTSGMTTMQKNEVLQQRRSPSIDASSICAHLYWLLTKKIPGEEHAKKGEPPPHEKIMEDDPNIWNNIIQQAIKAEGKLRLVISKWKQWIRSFYCIDLGSKCSEARLKRYLFDVFDRGFADATHQWTVDQLLCHLNIMCNYLDTDIVNSDQSLNLLSDLIFSSKSASLFDQFSPAAHMFERAKKYFVEKSSSASIIYHWGTSTKFSWINELAVHQRTNVDLLHYYDRDFKMQAIEIYCVAKMDEKMGINMFVGSIINGINLQLPVYTLTVQERNKIFKSITTEAEMVSFHDPKLQDPFNEIFVEELHTLICISRQKNTQ
jgi:serine/threonine protein kinase